MITRILLTHLICGGFFLLIGMGCYSVKSTSLSDDESIIGASENGDLKEVKRLESIGVSLNTQTIYSFAWTPLIAAIYYQQTNVIAYLITRNIDINLQDRDGKTALMWAIIRQDVATSKQLLERKPKLNIKDKHGNTALDYAKAPGASVSPDILHLFNDVARH